MQTIFIRICADTPAKIAFKKYFSVDFGHFPGANKFDIDGLAQVCTISCE